jgi:ribonuclease VapC
MIVDASAIVALLLDEPEARSLADRLEAAPTRATHPVSIYEAALAIARSWRSSPGEAEADVNLLLAGSDLRVLPIGPDEAAAALDAFAKYGKGRHAAKLNMGDCFSYACAKLRGMPLLYKGDDFALTDLA